MDIKRKDELLKAKKNFGRADFNADEYCKRYFELNTVDNSSTHITELRNQKVNFNLYI